MDTPEEPLTVILNNGAVVLATLYHGKPFAVTYAQRTQAASRVCHLGQGWAVAQFSGHPFYVVKTAVLP